MGLFKRRSPEVVQKRDTTRILFTSDIHGSEVVFRKLLNAGKIYKVDAIVIGGDVAGKRLVPCVEVEPGKFRVAGKTVGREGLKLVLDEIKASGDYYVEVNEKDYKAMTEDDKLVQKTFMEQMIKRLREWVALAEEKYSGTGIPIYANLGNDDPEYLFQVFREGDVLSSVEGTVVSMGGSEMISLGYVNPTPWRTPRELPEEELYSRLKAYMSKVEEPSKVILNLHAPPYGTKLDSAPLLDKDLKPVVKGGDLVMSHVGSRSVRRVLEEFQPLLGLHGHIHESRGFDKIGRSLILNPGSSYSQGVLQAVYVILERDKVKTHQFISG